MNEREKIIEIAMKAKWHDMFGDFQGIGEESAKAIADALISASYGNVSVWKARAEKAERGERVNKKALKLAVEEVRFCPYPPETVYNPDSECEEQVPNCDFGNDRAECEECVMKYFLQQAEREIEEEERK